jgi:hypothetical protein
MNIIVDDVAIQIKNAIIDSAELWLAGQKWKTHGH